LENDHIVRVLGLSTDGMEEFFMMEWMSGGSLSDYLKKSNGPPPFHEILDFSNQIAEGLAYLHSKKVIHRDLACRNILWEMRGNRMHLKITDFGKNFPFFIIIFIIIVYLLSKINRTFKTNPRSIGHHHHFSVAFVVFGS
jgi:serine/threonine protein kinase